MLLGLAVFLVCLVADVVCVCPNGFIKHDNACYMIFSIRGTWSEAQGYCKALDSTLTVIENSKEEHFLEGQLSRLSSSTFNPGKFWVAGSNLLTDGQWQWLPGGDPVTDTNWGPGEPDNINQSEHCIALEFVTHLKWNDEDCEERNNFICKRLPLPE